jgi:hypothetical protein
VTLGGIVAMSDIQIHINKLANEIGPRGSTSNEEKQAAVYISEYLSSLGGLSVQTQSFQSPWTWSWPNSITLFIALIGVGSYPLSPIIGVILVFLAIIFFFAENDNRPILSRLMPKQSSQNVIGRLEPSTGKKIQSIVLVAHMDSSRADYVHQPDQVKNFRKLVLLNFGLFWIILFLMIIGIFLDLTETTVLINDIEWFFSVLLAIPVAYSFFLAVTRQSKYEIVAGANDNASGVAVVLDLMKELKKDPLKSTELIGVLTGCEEVNCNGMFAFLAEYGRELRDANFLNFDNVGAGTPIFTPKEGIFYAHQADATLLSLARSVQKDLPESKVVEQPFRAGYTDGTAAMVRGFKVLSFLALNEYSVPPNWHWYTDTVENIDEVVISEIKEFAIKLIRKIDSNPSA